MASLVTLTSLELTMRARPAGAPSLLAAYLKRNLSPDAWYRLVKGRSEYRTIWFLLRLRLYRLFGRGRRILADYVGAAGGTEARERRSGPPRRVSSREDRKVEPQILRRGGTEGVAFADDGVVATGHTMKGMAARTTGAR